VRVRVQAPVLEAAPSAADSAVVLEQAPQQERQHQP
jgi:hypothetical protein